jgi:SAM-dependent methyltransferase
MKQSLDAQYWQQRWETGQTGWDIGYASPALVNYLQRATDPSMSILIPGAGNAYEAVWLWERGYKNVTVVDIAAGALAALQKRAPGFPPQNCIHGDFFQLTGSFDLVLEQTFFCALEPGLRPEYVRKMRELIGVGGNLAGLWFDFPLTEEGPPFGGSEAEYRQLFEQGFQIQIMQRCDNSIKPREGRELWVELLRV